MRRVAPPTNNFHASGDINPPEEMPPCLRTTQLCGGPLDLMRPSRLRWPVRSSTWFGSVFSRPRPFFLSPGLDLGSSSALDIPLFDSAGVIWPRVNLYCAH